MSWGTKRRNTIVAIFSFITLTIVGTYLFNVLYEPPNCFDQKQNGTEAGVDCGGTCELMCAHQIIEPIVHWRRSFEVAPGVYNVLAYVENPNPTAGVDEVSYRFGMYDADNVLLQERTGSIKLPPKAIVPIIENTLAAGKLDAARVGFEFTNELVWKRREPEEPVIIVQDEELLNEETAPRVQAMLRNTDLVAVPKVRLVAIMYDRNDNAIGSSSTIIDRVPANGSVPVFFTWPQPFNASIARFEIIPLYERSTR